MKITIFHGKSTISMAIFNSYVKLPEGMSYVIVALLFNQSIPGIPWKSLHEPMGFMEEKKQFMIKTWYSQWLYSISYGYAMVILHIISIFSLLPHSFIPSLSRWFSRHLTIFAIILPFQRSAPKPSPQQGAQVLPAMSHHKVYPALLCRRALLLERNYVAVVTLQNDRCW